VLQSGAAWLAATAAAGLGACHDAAPSVTGANLYAFSSPSCINLDLQ
jgi:hypothetical protein